MKKITFWVILISLIIIMTLVLVFIAEGFSSFILFTRNALPFSESRHTKYDSLLGWSNIPGFQEKNFYGKHKNLTINQQGFRNLINFPKDIPEGKIRILCSGDSFTLGYGVDDQETWCQQLSQIEPKLETVNMGQGGYGVDQVYLWYKRDGIKLDHQIHIFTFIGNDFERMESTLFETYPKPILNVENNNLEVNNIPVPRLSTFNIHSNRIFRASGQFKFVELVQKINLGNYSPNSPNPDILYGEQHISVLYKLFTDLKEINQNKQSKLLMVYLPVQSEYQKTSAWNITIARILQDLEIEYIDLSPDFNQLNLDTHTSLFNGHYSAVGNKFVADTLYQKISRYLN